MPTDGTRHNGGVSTEPPPLSQNGETGATDNVDRIREILFGAQSREYSKRLLQLEERFLREIGELKVEVRRHLDSLEAHAQLETQALSDRLSAERAERAEAAERSSRELADSVNSLTKRLRQSEEQVSKEMQEFRQAELERHNRLSDELMHSIAAVGLLLGQRLDELRSSAMDRTALANCLAELSLRIRSETGISGSERRTTDEVEE